MVESCYPDITLPLLFDHPLWLNSEIQWTSPRVLANIITYSGTMYGRKYTHFDDDNVPSRREREARSRSPAFHQSHAYQAPPKGYTSRISVTPQSRAETANPTRKERRRSPTPPRDRRRESSRDNEGRVTSKGEKSKREPDLYGSPPVSWEHVRQCDGSKKRRAPSPEGNSAPSYQPVSPDNRTGSIKGCTRTTPRGETADSNNRFESIQRRKVAKKNPKGYSEDIKGKRKGNSNQKNPTKGKTSHSHKSVTSVPPKPGPVSLSLTDNSTAAREGEGDRGLPQRETLQAPLVIPSAQHWVDLTMDEGDLLPDPSPSALAGSPLTSSVPCYEQVAEAILKVGEEKERSRTPVASPSIPNLVEFTTQKPGRFVQEEGEVDLGKSPGIVLSAGILPEGSPSLGDDLSALVTPLIKGDSPSQSSQLVGELSREEDLPQQTDTEPAPIQLGTYNNILEAAEYFTQTFPPEDYNKLRSALPNTLSEDVVYTLQPGESNLTGEPLQFKCTGDYLYAVVEGNRVTTSTSESHPELRDPTPASPPLSEVSKSIPAIGNPGPSTDQYKIYVPKTLNSPEYKESANINLQELCSQTIEEVLESPITQQSTGGSETTPTTVLGLDNMTKDPHRAPSYADKGLTLAGAPDTQAHPGSSAPRAPTRPPPVAHQRVSYICPGCNRTHFVTGEELCGGTSQVLLRGIICSCKTVIPTVPESSDEAVILNLFAK